MIAPVAVVSTELKRVEVVCCSAIETNTTFRHFRFFLIFLFFLLFLWRVIAFFNRSFSGFLQWFHTRLLFFFRESLASNFSFLKYLLCSLFATLYMHLDFPSLYLRNAICIFFAFLYLFGVFCQNFLLASLSCIVHSNLH